MRLEYKLEEIQGYLYLCCYRNEELFYCCCAM